MPLMGFGFVALLVYRTQDLGSVVVMGLVLYVMMFFARARWIYFTILGIASLPLLLYVTVFSEGYRRDRMLAFGIRGLLKAQLAITCNRRKWPSPPAAPMVWALVRGF